MLSTRGTIMNAAMIGVGAMTLTGLAACGSGSPAAVAGASKPQTSDSAGQTLDDADTVAATTKQQSSADAGCQATGAKIPKGASVTKTFDLDGDGAADRIWIAGSRKGVATASGAVSSLPISNGGGPVTVFAQMLDNGVPAVVESGRQAYLSAFVDCSLVVTKNAQGQQYRFDVGFTDAKADYGCAGGEDVVDLVGLKVASTGQEGTEPWWLTQTVVKISDDGTRATNGKKSALSHYHTQAQALAGMKQVSSANTCSPERVSAS